MSGPFAIEARALAIGFPRRRGAVPLCADLDLAVAAGEFVCLVGRNGIGKTTLLRTLAAAQRPLAGTVRVGGRDVASMRPLEVARLVGLVETRPVEVGALSSYEVVALGRYPHTGWSGGLSASDHAAVAHAIASVGATALARRDIGELSDGERQRINVARALAQEPRVLILDEPMAFLDLPSRENLAGLLRDLAHEHGLAIIASTHDLDLALRSAGTLWLMAGGRVHTGAPGDRGLAAQLSAAFGLRRSPPPAAVLTL